MGADGAPGARLPRRSAAPISARTTRKPGTSGLVMLEVNTQPGMTPLSLVPEQATWAGISLPELVTWMVEHARHPT